MQRRHMIVVLTVALVFLVAVAVFANAQGPKVPKRLTPDDTEQTFDGQASPVVYRYPADDIIRAAKHPKKHHQHFHRHASFMSNQDMKARGESPCPSGAQGWVFHKAFVTHSVVTSAVELAAPSFEILWCARNGHTVPGTLKAFPTNHCGKSRIGAVYNYDGCKTNRGSLYLDKTHVWYVWHYHFDAKIFTYGLDPSLDVYVHADGRIGGVYVPT